METWRMYGTLIFVVIFRLTNSLNISNFGISWIMWLCLGIFVAIIIFWKKYGHTLKHWKLKIDKKIIKTQLKYAFWIFLWTNAWALLGQVDQQIIINFLGAKQAGYYTIFFTLLTAYGIIILPIIGLVFPIVTELITKQDKTRLGLMQTMFYKYFSVFALSISVIFFILGPNIASIFFWVKFIYAWNLLSYIAPFLVINVLIGINYSFLAGLGKVKERVFILFWAVLVNVILNISLIYWFKLWLIWAVIALIWWWLVLFWRTCIIINWYEPINFDWKFFGKNTLLISILVIIIWFIKKDIFILDDIMRYKNLLRLCIVCIIYYWIIASLNRSNIMILIREIKTLNKNEPV
jgi:O-antigen/teichoic acid export membrane protein